MSHDTEIIDLKRVRFPTESAMLLRSIKDSGASSHETYASLVRLYVLMGLRLHKVGIETMGQLETLLESETLDKPITKRKGTGRSPTAK